MSLIDTIYPPKQKFRLSHRAANQVPLTRNTSSRVGENWKPKSKFHKPFILNLEKKLDEINAKLDRLIIDIGRFMMLEITLDIVESQEEKLKEWVIVEQVDE